MRHFPKLAGLCLSLFAMVGVCSSAIAHETPKEAANKKVVVDFYGALNAADAAGTTSQRIKAIAEKYLAPGYVQHSEAFAGLSGPGSAREKLITMFQHMPAMPAMGAPTTVAVMAQGDLVMMLTARNMPDPATGKAKQAFIFNMFRVRNGQLVEHWDSPMPAGPGGPGMPPPSGALPAPNQ